MNEEPSFELAEITAFTGSASWRLKGRHLRFRGKRGDGSSLPPVQPIPVSNEQLRRFENSLQFLDVWSWKPEYDPIECGYAVCDAMSWSFNAKFAERKCASKGTNAYPSLAAVDEVTLEAERYAFLVFAFRYSFGITEDNLPGSRDWEFKA